MIFSLRSSTRPEQALVVRTGEIRKARTAGAVARNVSGGANGKIVILATGKVRRLEAKDRGREEDIFQYYRLHNIAFHYVPPGKRVKRAEIEAHLDSMAADAARPKKTPSPPLPEPVLTILDTQRDTSTARSAVDVLKERVANWKRPDAYEHAIDPKDKKELKDLISKRRSLAARRRGYGEQIDRLNTERPKGWKNELRALKLEQANAAKTYEQAGWRIRAIMGPKYPTVGGGFSTVDQRTAAVIEDLPYQDLGFHPASRPMSYLLSLGWHKRKTIARTGETVNEFSKREFDALLFEYGRFLNRTVGSIVRKFAPSIDTPGHAEEGAWSKRYRKTAFKRWQAKAQEVLYELAQQYAQRDTPSESSNFALYVHTVLPRRMVAEVKEDIGKESEEVLFSELDDMPTRNGQTLTPAVRIETPEQALHREELETQASAVLGKLLKPMEMAVLQARLNILNPHPTEGVYQPKRGEMTLDVGALRPFSKVKEDVIANLGKFFTAPEELAAAEEQLKGATRKFFEAQYDEAMETISSKLGAKAGTNLSEEKREIVKQLKILRKLPKESAAVATPQIEALNSRLDELRQEKDEMRDARRVLAELANAKRLYLEGVRHRVWRHADPETFREGGYIGKLVTKPKKIDMADLMALEEKHSALTAKIDASRSRSEIEKLLKRRLEVSRQLTTMRGEARLTREQSRLLSMPKPKKRKASLSKSLVILDAAAAWRALEVECRLWRWNGF